MAKAPAPGMTKTRLRLPPYNAAGLQTALIRDTVEKVLSLNLGSVVVFATPPDKLILLEPLLLTGVRLLAQSGRDLGERMHAAAARLFEEGSEPVLILGADAPTLPQASILRAAYVLEKQYDASIVGSTDGGYVLLGLKEPQEVLFHGIEWSTAYVYRETVRKALGLGLQVHEGEHHYDVDVPEDLARLKKELEEAPRLAPHTAKFLKSLQEQKGARILSAPQG